MNAINPDNVVVPWCSLWQEWQNHFTIDQFLFSLFLGLIPTAWDMFSDLNFGADLESMNEVSAAGFTKLQLHDMDVFLRLLRVNWFYLR